MESAREFVRGEKGIDQAAEPGLVLHWRLYLKVCKCKSLFKPSGKVEDLRLLSLSQL